MDELWLPPDPAVADAIRTLCQQLLERADSLVESVTEPSLEAQADPALLADASLAGEDRDLIRSDVFQWLTSNVRHPGQRVEPYVGPRAAEYISDLASRGITPDFAGAWRVTLGILWRQWVEECTSCCGEREVLVDVLDVSAKSLVQYALDSVAALRETSMAAAMGNADPESIALIQLIASGASVPEDLAERRLRHRMPRQHVALVLWVDDPAGSEALDTCVAALRSAAPARSVLVARASATSRWIWLSGTQAPQAARIEKVLGASPGVRAGVGRAGRGLEGFRSSHQQALAAQALVVRLASERAVTAYADVELIDALTRDQASARRFVLSTLGPLADADEVLRHTLLTYVQCGFNTTRTAADLYAHRNTVERRVSRANELSTVKVEDNPTHVGAALLVLEIAPRIVLPMED